MPTLGAIMPALPVRNLDAALALYCEKLGFAVRHRMDGGEVRSLSATTQSCISRC